MQSATASVDADHYRQELLAERKLHDFQVQCYLELIQDLDAALRSIIQHPELAVEIAQGALEE